MSELTRAVFLSYASQDAEAVQRMAEALRAVGAEVWFDKNELTGGDAWDAKIRGQIGSCALFVPVISAATQARDEGYFRLEWKLAVDRSHLMAHDKPFMLPVVIDATTDAAARVPPEFRAVQWTRLPGGETTPAFCARVKKLLTGEGRDASPRRPSSDSDESHGRLGETSLPPKPTHPWLVPAILAVAAVVTLALWQPWRAKEKTVARSSPVAAAATLTEAQKLVEKARKIFDESDELNRENYYLAEDLVERATKLDPTEPSAWALHAQISYYMVWQSIDASEARIEAMRSQAERAHALAPEMSDAVIAWADARYYLRQDLPGVERDLLAVAAREPKNWLVQRSLGRVYRYLGRYDDAIEAHRQAVALSDGAPKAEADLANVLVRSHHLDEAEATLKQALAKHASGRLRASDVFVRTQWRGDMAGAEAALATWPDWLLVEDRGAIMAWRAALWGKQPEKALAIAQRMQRDYLRDTFFIGPRAVLTARAHEMAGHREAAREDWRTVAQAADRVLASAPTDSSAAYWKAWALARLGDVAQAQALAVQMQQRNQLSFRAVASNPIAAYYYFQCPSAAALWATVGRPDLALAELRGPAPLNDDTPITRAMLELDPAFDPLRTEAGFKDVLVAALAPEKKVVPTPGAVSLDDKAVAVLPFANLSGDKEQEYFSDGLTEEILNALARERDLRVPGRTSSFSFKGKNATPAEIASALNVSRLVEGSVQRAGTKVRIRVSLTRVADNASEEVGTFTEELTDIFALQDKVARAVVEKLTHRATKSSVEVLTKNAEAYDFYLRGRALQTRTAANRNEAAKLYERAVELDPAFALAWARLAESRFRSYGAGSDRSAELVTSTRNAIDRALQAQPDLPEALIVRANWSRYAQNDLTAARKDLERAEALQPPTAELRLAQAALARERDDYAEALRQAEACLSLDPQNGDNTNTIAFIYYNPRGDYVKADRLFVRGMAISGLGESSPFNNRVLIRMRWRGAEAALRLAEHAPIGQAGAEFIRASWLSQLGRVAEAKALIDEAERKANVATPETSANVGGGARATIAQLYAVGELDLARRRAEGIRSDAMKQVARGNRGPNVMNSLARAEFVLGHQAAALTAMDEMRRDARSRLGAFLRICEGNFRVFGLYAQLGKPDEEIALIREFLSAGFHLGYELRDNPDFAPVRADPRFQEMMKQESAWAAALPDPIDP